MRLKQCVILFCILFFMHFSHVMASISYKNYSLYKLTARNKYQLDKLRQLESNTQEIDFWTSPRSISQTVDVLVPTKLKEEFLEFVNEIDVRIDQTIENLQTILDNEKRTRKFARNSETSFWSDFRNLTEIYDWIDSLVEAYPHILTKIEIGTSYEGRKIYAVELSPGNTTRGGIFLEGGAHAREWISPSTITFIINELLTSTEQHVIEMRDSYDWYFVIILNPDGYAYTSTDRMWRKTRSIHYHDCSDDGVTFGVDPNRNWDYKWMGSEGASDIPCTSTYAGPYAFSEPETKAVADYINTIGDTLHIYISVHSYGQVILIPYGHTTEHLDNFGEAYEAGVVSAGALATRYGTNFTVGNTAELMYLSPGGSDDWVKGVHGVRFTYCYELRDLGANGFILPPELIVPSGKEFLDSMIALAEYNLASDSFGGITPSDAIF